MKDILGYEGIYKISSKGEITNINGELLKPFIVKGYSRINLYKNGIKKQYRVHRLVAQHFITNPHNLPQVDHQDENKANNSVSNLRWCTNKDNATWYYKNNPTVIATGHAPKSILVNEYPFPSCGQAAKHIASLTGKNQATISKELRRVLNGLRPEGVMYGKFVIKIPS